MKPFISIPKIAVLCIFVVACIQSQAQLVDYGNLLEKWRQDYPQEKLFLQSNQSQYFPGDDIFMKVWCTADGLPTYLSRIVYVDMADAAGKVMFKKMYWLDSLGSTGADFTLPDDIGSGTYTLHAYTLWMLNFPGFIASKDIYVFGRDYKTISKQKVKPAIHIDFFPEGGHWSDGVPGRVAFKATDEKGMPVSVAGILIDQTGGKWADVQTAHDGMGIINLDTPRARFTYYLQLTSTSGAIKKFALPKPSDSALVLRVENLQPGRLFAQLYVPEKSKELYKQVTVIGQMNGSLVFKAGLQLEAGEMTVPVPKKQLPSGVMQITVFDMQGMPLAERLAFIANYQMIEPTIEPIKMNTSPRSLNQWRFTTGDSTSSTLSVLVRNDMGAGQKIYENNIVSSMLATADLRGYIHEPGQYFMNKDAATLQHLDLVMMTNGWRRFDWKQLVANQPVPLTYPVEASIVLSGMVHKSDRGTPVSDGFVSFIIKSKDSATVIAEAPVNKQGQFALPGLNFSGEADVAYMGTNKAREGLIVDVKLHPGYVDTLKNSGSVSAVNLDTTSLTGGRSPWSNYLRNQLAQMDTGGFGGFSYLGSVTIKRRALSREDSLNKEYAQGPFLMGTSIDPSEYRSYQSIWQIVQASVPGITVTGDMFNPTVSFNRFGLNDALSQNSRTIDLASSSTGDNTVGLVLETNGIAYFLNEVPVSKDLINTLVPSEVALIKVMKNEAAMLGATQGALIFYTKKGLAGIDRAVYEKRYMKTTRQGYALVKTFYSPNYTAIPDLNAGTTDTRQTLYWSHQPVKHSDGWYYGSFHQNDTGGKVLVIIQGLGANGELIYGQQWLP